MWRVALVVAMLLAMSGVILAGGYRCHGGHGARIGSVIRIEGC